MGRSLPSHEKERKLADRGRACPKAPGPERVGRAECHQVDTESEQKAVGGGWGGELDLVSHEANFKWIQRNNKMTLKDFSAGSNEMRLVF